MSAPSALNNKDLRCPFPSCTWTCEGSRGHHKKLRAHLSILHSDELASIPTNIYRNLNVYLCTQCSHICATNRSLTNHQLHAHANVRSKTNVDLITATFRQRDIHASRQQWTSTLEWLYKLDIRPPQKRSSAFHTLLPSTKQKILVLLNHVISWTLTASLPLDADADATTTPVHLSTSTPFFKLLLIFEQLLLTPVPLAQHRRRATIIDQRIALFKQGRLTQLYEEAFLSPSVDTVPNDIETPIFDDMSFCPSAQRAANLDNLHAAFQRVRSALPVAALTPDRLKILQKLYPERVSYTAPNQTARPTTRANGTTQSIPIKPTQKQVLTMLRKLRKGTAFWPFLCLH